MTSKTFVVTEPHSPVGRELIEKLVSAGSVVHAFVRHGEPIELVSGVRYHSLAKSRNNEAIRKVFRDSDAAFHPDEVSTLEETEMFFDAAANSGAEVILLQSFARDMWGSKHTARSLRGARKAAVSTLCEYYAWERGLLHKTLEVDEIFIPGAGCTKGILERDNMIAAEPGDKVSLVHVKDVVDTMIQMATAVGAELDASLCSPKTWIDISEYLELAGIEGAEYHPSVADPEDNRGRLVADSDLDKYVEFRPRKVG